MQGSMGKAVCDHVIRDSIKMYTHKGAQLRLHEQHYSFSFSLFFFIVLGFIATFMVLYPFIYNFIGCLKKKYRKGEKRKPEKNLLYGMAVILKFRAGTSWSTAEALATWMERAMSESAHGAGWREAVLGCTQLSLEILQHRNAGHHVSRLCLSGLCLVAFHCFPLQILFSHVLPPTPRPCLATIFLQMQPLNSSSPSF